MVKKTLPVAYAAAATPLEHIPEKWTPLFRQEFAQAFELARFLFGQAVPPGRKMR
jgi:hypothetical protein